MKRPLEVNAELVLVSCPPLDVLQQRHGPAGARSRLASGGKLVPNSAVCDWALGDASFLDDAVFNLADKEGYPDVLAVVNPFPRDARCVFLERSHEYFVDGIKCPWSGTRFSHYCEKGFDADATLDTYLPRPGWAKGKGLVREDDGMDMDREEIKAKWNANGTIQSRRGTLLHWHIECHLNGYQVAKPHSPEFEMFLTFERSFLDALGLVPWRVEMNMFHCGLRLAGQADLICKDGNGKLVILDWKRSREIKSKGFRGEMQRPPLAHLPNANRHTYNLQLNTYRHILETEYGQEVSAMYIVVLHPQQAPSGPHVYEVPRMEREIELLVHEAHIDLGTSLDNFPGPDAPFDAIKFPAAR